MILELSCFDTSETIYIVGQHITYFKRIDSGATAVVVVGLQLPILVEETTDEILTALSGEEAGYV